MLLKIQNVLHLLISPLLVLNFKISSSLTKLTETWNSNKHDIFSSIVVLSYWAKVRSSYALNSWVYTTNHKRISINYLNFVLVAGTAGMSLATVIRLEFAYPGVGVLAGDSLQYLSIATAHGVIMVFFMIMPSIYGAFGNFLLPTQLGVHDVAFPRLNSAAFWFLPGGLIMLCQLVCTDRRYQRMNCFNIRELQGILKRRFFTDLVNSNDHRELLDSTMIGLRYKTNGLNSIEPDMPLFFNLGTTNSVKNKQLHLNPYVNFLLNEKNSDKTFFETIKSYYNSFDLFMDELVKPINNVISNFSIKNLFNIKVSLRFNQFSLSSIIEKFQTELTILFNISLNNLFQVFYVINPNTLFTTNTKAVNVKDSNSSENVVFSTEITNTVENSTESETRYTEYTSMFRNLRFFNPLVSYDYKSGNYLGIWESLYPSLFLSYIEVTRGVKKSSWYFSEQYSDLLKTSYKNFFSKFTYKSNLKLADVDAWYSSHVAPIDNFYNLYWTLDFKNNLVNNRWLSVNSLDQKFYHMFGSSSTQQRILGNWRSLKFTREAWRCKLLSARNQNTLYRRFTGEEGLVWSIERNAKDLIPGWAMITPFSARTRFTAIGRTDIGLMGVLLVINASIISSANFLVTYRYLSTLNNRKMRDARSFFAEALIVGSWMMIAANPMLAIGIIMLLFDRHWQTSFFDYSGGGDTVLFQHMFWFFGHPEVYVIMLPIFGYTNTMMSFYLRKRISARASLLYSMYTIAFLGFFVWGHHMYMVGLSHTTRMLFSTLTVMISVPAATKLMHWCVTIVNSTFQMELPLLFSLTFVYFFISGGVSGMCVAHTGMDILFHDSFYVIGHFHVMLAGSAMLGIFGAIYFYFPALYGVKYSRVYAYIHYTYYVIGQLLTVVPMMWLGYCGMPRRVLDYPSSLGGWHSIISSGHLLSVTAILSFFIMIYDSIRQAKPAIRNNFGVGRFNTRLNFYFFEINRLSFTQRKSLHLHRFNKTQTNYLQKFDPIEIYKLETTLFSYQFFKNESK